MSKFCPSCGKSVQATDAFCSNCGANLHPSNSKSRKTIILTSAFLCAILAGGGLYWYSASVANQTEQQVVTEKKEEPVADNQLEEKTQIAEAPTKKETPIEASKRILRDEFGLNLEVLATSYGNNPDGFIAYTPREGGVNLLIVDLKYHQIANPSVDRGFANLVAQQSKTSPSPLIVNFEIMNDKHDQDANNGVWENEYTHIIPMYILYKFDANGNIVPDNGLSSGPGQHPSHYQEFLREPSKIHLGKLFATEAMPFYRNAQKNNIRL